MYLIIRASTGVLTSVLPGLVLEGSVTLERDLFELQQLDLVLSLPNRSFRTVLRS